MKVEELPGYLKQNRLAIREQLLSGSYEPQPTSNAKEKEEIGASRYFLCFSVVTVTRMGLGSANRTSGSET